MTKATIHQTYFYTSDLALAGAISTVKSPPDHITNSNSDSNKKEFAFKREEGLDEAIQAFWNHKLRVDPLDYYTNLRILKNRIREGLRNG